MNKQDAEVEALNTLVKLLDSDNESIRLAAARTIYIERLHANAVQGGDA